MIWFSHWKQYWYEVTILSATLSCDISSAILNNIIWSTEIIQNLCACWWLITVKWTLMTQPDHIIGDQQLIFDEVTVFKLNENITILNLVVYSGNTGQSPSNPHITLTKLWWTPLTTWLQHTIEWHYNMILHTTYITWYCIQHCNDWNRTYIRIWIHQIPRPHREAMFFLWGFWRKLIAL